MWCVVYDTNLRRFLTLLRRRGCALIFAFLLVFMALPLSATTYYVDNCIVTGSDSNNGTSTSTPWLTISKVNGSSFSAGDSVLFESTCTWREQLTVPNSGSGGNPITFGAYGTGASPIINGSDLVTNWSLYSGATYEASVAWTPNQAFRGGTRLILDASVPTVDGHWYWASNVFYLCCGDSRSLTIEASHRSAAITVTNLSYLTFINLAVTKSNSSGGLLIYSDGDAISNITVDAVGSSYNYAQGILFYDNNGGTFTNLILTSDTSIYDAMSGGSAAGIQVGMGGSSVTGGGTTNVTMTNCHTSYAGVHGGGGSSIEDFGVALNHVNSAMVNNLTSDHNTSAGFTVGQESSNLTVRGGSIHDNGSLGDHDNIGVGGYSTANTSNILFDSVDIYNGSNYGIDVARTNVVNPRYVVAGLTFRYCRIHDNGTIGFHAGGHHAGLVLEYNLIYNNAQQGIVINDAAGDTINTSSNGSPEILVYGNTIWGNGTAGGSTNANISTGSNSTAGSDSFENNIVGQANGNEIEIPSGGQINFTSDYNDWYHPAGGTFMSWLGKTYSFANWKSNSNQDPHSLSSDPKLTNPSLANFALLPGSPSIGAGANLGSTYQFGLDPRTSFPWGILNQNSQGLGWEIGAFVFAQQVTPAPPTSISITVR
jgi:hypothetical protein